MRMVAGSGLEDDGDTTVLASHPSRDRARHQELPRSLSSPSAQSSLHSAAPRQLAGCNTTSTALRFTSQLISGRGQGRTFLRAACQEAAHWLGREALTEIKQSLIILRCQSAVPPKNTKFLGDRHWKGL